MPWVNTRCHRRKRFDEHFQSPEVRVAVPSTAMSCPRTRAVLKDRRSLHEASFLNGGCGDCHQFEEQWT
jgi:hypothetical protein